MYLSCMKLEPLKQSTNTKALGLKHTLGLKANHLATQALSLMIFVQVQTKVVIARRWSFLPSLGSFKVPEILEEKNEAKLV